MALCEVCRKINFGAILWPPQKNFPEAIGGWPRGNELYYYEATRMDGNLLVRYDSNLDKIKANAPDCELCLLILTCILDTLGNIKRSNDSGYPYIPESNYSFWLLGRKEADGFQVIGIHDEFRDQYRIMGGAGICVKNECSLSELIKGRVIATDPKSFPLRNAIHRWLQECKAEHGHEWSQNREGPMRILKIEDNGRMFKLDETRQDNVEYAALSYCWGDAQQLTLSNTSVTQLRKGLKTAKLPQTFQDAIWTAYELGIEYIWIDSLCIFQDNPNDWVQESARMAHVYGNAVLTLAANRATSSSEGFLGLRTERNYVTAPFTHGQLSGELLIFPLDVKLVGDTSRYVRLENEPLSSRGWAMQERYLSTRTLHFDNSQISFECPGSFITEDRCSASPSRYNWQYRRPYPESWEAEWQQVVILYSQRELTKKADKLPAISGIAELFAATSTTNITDKSLNNRYLAGLWEHNIISDLCWEVDPRKRRQGRYYPYRAPSWSWATLDSAIWFRCLKNEPLAMFRNAHVDIDSSGCPYGAVSGGWLLVRGRKYPLCFSNASAEAGFVFSSEESKIRIPVIWNWDDLSCVSAISAEAKSDYWETDLKAIPVAYDRSIFFILAKAVEHKVHSLATIQGFERVGSATSEITGQSHDIVEDFAILTSEV